MIAYICDVCEESIANCEERYILKISEVNRKIKVPKTVCLCSKCKSTWAEKIPQLFAMEVRER